MHPKRKNLLILHPWFFGWFALLPLLWWGYKAWQQNPDFIRWLIDWYVIRRTKGAVFGQTGPVGYYLATIVVFFASYFVFFPAALKNSIKALWEKPKGQWFLIGAWMVSGWFIYEFLKSKLPAYVIAAYPAIAMAIGYQIVKWSEDLQDITLMRVSAALQLLIVLSITGGIAFFGRTFFRNASDFGQALGIAVVYLMLMIYGLGRIWVGRILDGSKILMLGSGLFLFLSLALVLPKLDYLRNAPERTAQYIKDHSPQAQVIVVANHFGDPPSLPFYLETYMPDAKLIYTHDQKVIDSVFNNTQNCVLILNEKQINHILSQKPHLQYNLIQSHAVDRPANLEYFIIIKH